jgi:hypothetical protein
MIAIETKILTELYTLAEFQGHHIEFGRDGELSMAPRNSHEL